MWQSALVAASVLLAGFGVYQVSEGNSGGGIAMIAVAAGGVTVAMMLRGRR